MYFVSDANFHKSYDNCDSSYFISSRALLSNDWQLTVIVSNKLNNHVQVNHYKQLSKCTCHNINVNRNFLYPPWRSVYTPSIILLSSSCVTFLIPSTVKGFPFIYNDRSFF